MSFPFPVKYGQSLVQLFCGHSSVLHKMQAVHLLQSFSQLVFLYHHCCCWKMPRIEYLIFVIPDLKSTFSFLVYSIIFIFFSLLTVLPEMIMYINLDFRHDCYFANVFHNTFFFFFFLIRNWINPRRK